MYIVPKNITLGFAPHPYQVALDHAMLYVRFFVAVCHRRFGKTEFALVKLIGSALRLRLPEGQYAYVAPFLKQAKKVAWGRLKKYTRHLPGYHANEAELWVKFRNAGGEWSTIQLYGADNPDALRGTYLDGLVVDEVAQVGEYVWQVILRPMLVDRSGWALFIGTPAGQNLFKDLWDRAEKDPGWGRAMFRASETNLSWVTAEEKAQVRAEQGEEFYNQEFECDFYALVYNILIPLSSVQAACERIVKTEHELRGYPKILGVDVARFGHHQSSISKRWGPWYPDCRKLRWRGLDTMSLAAKVVEINHEWRPDAIFIDAGGVGGGVIDRCRQLGVSVVEVHFGQRLPDTPWFNMRTKMWCLLAKHIEEVAVLPGEDSEMKTELSSLTYHMQGDQREIERKEGDPEQNVKRQKPLKSPDVGDSMALTHAHPVQLKDPQSYRDLSDMGQSSKAGSIRNWKPGWQR